MAAGRPNKRMSTDMVGFLAAAGASLAASMAALFCAMREPGLSLRPLWAALALVGTGGGAMVWQAPGEIFWFFGVAVPTVSYSAAPGGWDPQVVRVLFPAGALIVAARIALRRRHARIETQGPFE